MFFAPSKSRYKAKIWIIGMSKASDHIQMDVISTFKIKIERQNLDHGYVKDQGPYQNQDQDAKFQPGTSSILQSLRSGLKEHGCSLHFQNTDEEPKTSDNIPIKIKIPSLSWEPQHPPKLKIRTKRT